jgi:predicted DNA-binding protein
MSIQTSVRLPEELAGEAGAVARAWGTSVNALIIEALTSEIERVREDSEFTNRARRLLESDRVLIASRRDWILPTRLCMLPQAGFGNEEFGHLRQGGGARLPPRLEPSAGRRQQEAAWAAL